MCLALLSNRKVRIVHKIKIPGIEWLVGNHPSIEKATVQKVLAKLKRIKTEILKCPNMFRFSDQTWFSMH